MPPVLENPSHVVDPALLARFDVRGPRYTSYPTADRFTTLADPSAHVARLCNRDPLGPPLALYMHLPFCQSVCYYCGCNKVVTRDFSRRPRYIQAISREIGLQAALLRGRTQVSQLHWGGGTPNFFDLGQMTDLMSAVRSHFDLQPDAELSIEVDPRTLPLEMVDGLAALGFGRMSIGVQDFDPAVQRAIHRVQSAECTEQVMKRARQQGFRSINLDLIYGLPKQHAASFGRTLDTLLDLDPDRVALYNYAHLPALFKPQRRIDEADLPSGAERIGLLALAIDCLTRAGYVYIGMDHFAKPGDDLAIAQRQGRLHRNFQGYSTHADGDLMAFGLSAISRVGASYAQNAKTLEEYYRDVEADKLPYRRGIVMSAEDRLRAEVIQRLMCDFSLRPSALAAKHHIDFGHHFKLEYEALERFAEAGLVDLHPDHIEITGAGRFFVRNVAMCFDQHLRQAVTPAAYSRAV